MFSRSNDSLPAIAGRTRFSPLSVVDYLALFDDVGPAALTRDVCLDAFAPAAGMLEVRQ